MSADSAQNAQRWQTRLFQKIADVGVIPRGCSHAPENEYVAAEVRQFIFGRYRVLFTIRDVDAVVYILTIRHGARRFLTGEEVEGIE